MGKKILIAEDESFTRSVIETGLRRSGATVFASPDGEDALAKMTGNVVFDTVLLDLLMPRAHGLHVLREVRTGRTAQPRNTPVGILTSASDKRSVTLAMALDADAFLVKPINRTVMVERLEQLAFRGARVMKDTAIYDAIETPPATDFDAAEPQRPATPSPAAPINPGLSRVDTTSLKPGMLLAEDLVTIDGDLVVPAGVLVSDMLLGVLNDLRKLVQIKPVAVR